MAGGVVLEFAQFGAYDSFDILRSSFPMDINSLPTPIITGLTKTSYVDMAVVLGESYYYRVAVWRDGVRKVSSEEVLISAGSGGDPYWVNVVALLEVRGGAIVERAPLAGHTWVQGPSALPAVVVNTGYLSQKSIFFDRASLLKTSSPLPMGDNDFTIEAFLYNQEANYSTIASFFNSQGRFTWMIRDTGSNVSVWDSDWRFYHAPAQKMRNRWCHVALCREGNTYKSFVDGVLIGTATWVSPHKNFIGRQTIIGSSEPGGRDHFTGRIEQLRITKNVARYTASFTPLTLPFPSVD